MEKDLMQVGTMLDNALTYYGDGTDEGVRIAYISDIHLHHHLEYYDNDEELMIAEIVDRLYHSLENMDKGQFNQIYAVFFGGDISETPEMTLKFFKAFRAKVAIPIFFVLGNHEYIEFYTVQSCVEFYRKKLKKLGIVLLHNEYVECSYMEEKFMIFGGTGFAKYDEVYNANNIICCSSFNREDEIEETTVFEKAYQTALNIAQEEKKCLLCLFHYSVSACLNNKYDKEAIYFTGHNHCNEYIREENRVLYADNQVGYHRKNIAFREATTGLIINPYGGLSDGGHPTSVDEYLQFYRYLGETISGDGVLLYRRSQKAYLYVIKSKGYYGFFMVSTSGGSKGISIVNGGVTKKLTKSIDFSWIYKNFDIVVSKYLKALLPLRKVQEELSSELIELGLDGTIHGLIVDIDFYHHIELNPIEEKMNFYYASTFGSKMYLNSFNEVLESLEYHCSLGCEKEKYELIRKQYKERLKDRRYLLRNDSGGNMLETEHYEAENISQRVEQLVSRKDGMYGMSRKISPLQRLFTGRVLRDFDLILTETKQQSAHRKKLYIGRVFKYEGVRYQIVEDNGGDIVVIEELKKGSRSKGNGIRLSGKRSEFVLEELKAKIKSKKAYWIDEQA